MILAASSLFWGPQICEANIFRTKSQVLVIFTGWGVASFLPGGAGLDVHPWIATTFLRTGLPIKDGRVQKWPTIISPVVNSRHARRIIMAGPMRSSLWCRGWQRLGGALASLSFEQHQGKQPLICQDLITARPRPL